jgi:hypothetical protein
MATLEAPRLQRSPACDLISPNLRSLTALILQRRH